MSRESLTFHEAYQAACTYGDMFAGYENPVHQTELTFPVREETRRLCFDRQTLQANQRVYADGPELTQALQESGVSRLHSLAEAVEFLGDKYRNTSRIVIGFCGFTGSDLTGELNYHAEASAIQAVYRTLEADRRSPILAVNGAMRTGILGISTLVAQSFWVPSMGYAPLQGLKKIAPQSHLVISGNTYGDRQPLVGATGDLLVAMGGKKGTENECRIALDKGSVVYLLSAHDYDEDTFPYTYSNNPRFVEAEEDGQLVVCRRTSELRSTLRQAVDRTMDQAIATRPTRHNFISRHLLNHDLDEAG
jgi:hypothetical protein